MAVDQTIIDNLVKQILASSDSSKWKGEGKGSAQANAADMANILAKAGITDIKQLGVRQEVIPAMYGEGLNEPEQIVNKYYNKETGQELENTYGERQIGTFFGGTYSGKGNTGYGVAFDAQGNPQFFTSGASSSDLTRDTLLALGVMGGIGLATSGLGAVGTEGLLSGGTTGSTAATTGALSTEAGGLLTGGAGTLGTTGMTAAELAQLDLALGGAGGTAGAETLAAALTTGATVPTITSLTGGSGLLTGEAAGITAETVANKLAADATAQTIASKLGANLPQGWETLNPQEKISWLNANNITGEQLLNAGVPQADVSWMAQNGLNASTTAGLTAAELAQLDLALGGAGGTAGAESLGAALTTGAETTTLTNLTGGSGLLTGAAGGITAETVANKLAADAATQAIATKLGVNLPAGWEGLTAQEKITWLNANNITAAQLATAGVSQADIAYMTQNGLGGAALAGTTGALTNAATTAATTAATGGLSGTVTDALTKAGTGLLSGLTGQQLAGLISGGLTTAGGLLQQQTSREAAQQAQARIDAETAVAKEAAQFRPVGMTTRFGASNFTYNPTTGRLESAGYTLSPEAKAQQDRLMALSNQGLTQAEQAQGQFAPLQTGAQSLFNLGNKYLAQTPEEVAQRYINQQMQLLQPSRELELANLQNRLQQQGRAGLSVAQGGNLGATTPELQALYNARAQQELALAAQAQQAGQQQVQFGAGLLGQGAGAMGQYYAGQQAAYAPYTTAMGQVQNLEAQGQQPFALSQGLAQQQAQAGANAGRLGLTGAQLSAGLATSNAATTNPYATVLGGLGSPTSLLGQGLANWTTGLLSSPSTAVAGNPLAVGEFANPGYWT